MPEARNRQCAQRGFVEVVATAAGSQEDFRAGRKLEPARPERFQPEPMVVGRHPGRLLLRPRVADIAPPLDSVRHRDVLRDRRHGVEDLSCSGEQGNGRPPKSYPRRSQRGPKLSKSCRTVVQQVTNSCPASRELAQFRPRLADLGHIFADVGHKVDELRPKVAKFGPELAVIGQQLAQHDQL